MATHGGKQPNAAAKERTGTSPSSRRGTSPSSRTGTSPTSSTVPRQTRVPSSTKTNPSKLTSSSSTLSRNSKPTGSTSPALNRGRSFDNKSSSSSNVPLQKSHSTITSRSTRTTTMPVATKSQTRSSSVNQRPGIGTILNKKAANSNVILNRKVKSGEAVKADPAPVIAAEENNEGLGLVATGDSDREDEQQSIGGEEEEQGQEEEEEVIDEETSTHLQMGEEKEKEKEKEEQININEDDQSEDKIETSHNDDLPVDVKEQINNNIETSDHIPPPPMGEDDEPINIETNVDPPMGEDDEPINIETNDDPPKGKEEQIKIDDHNHQAVEEDQVQDDPIKEKEDQVQHDPIKEKEDEIEREIISPEETVEAQEKPQQETEPEKEEKPAAQEGGEKFLKATEIMKLMEAQTSGKDLTSASPRHLFRGGSGINRGSFNKKEVSSPTAAYNEVIEETASKLIAEKRKNKVLALAGAFETVISLQQD